MKPSDLSPFTMARKPNLKHADIFGWIYTPSTAPGVLDRMNGKGISRWYALTTCRKESESEGLNAEVSVAPDSPWFSGHFPGEPILPGIAQLAMVLETLGAAADKRMRIAGLRRVRFKLAVRPEEILKVYVKPNGKSATSHSFQIKIGDAIACSGTLIAEVTDS